jgi:hypothetical protein
MRRQQLAVIGLAFVSACVLSTVACAQEKSGLQLGELLPGSFAAYNLNGPSKGLYHSLVCEFALRPVVLVFVRERRDGKDKSVLEFLQKLDEAVGKSHAIGLQGAVIFLSRDARSSFDEGKTENVDDVLAEEKAREELRDRLAPIAKGLKNLIAATYPALGPTGYGLSPKAEVTVILYERLHVRAIWTFSEGQPDAQAIQQVLDGVEKLVPQGKK